MTQPPSTPVAVTANNATQVSATALKPAVGGGALATAGGLETTAAPQARVVTRALLAVARDSKTQLSASQGVVGAAAQTTCSFGGTKTADISADGTSGTFTFNACSDIAGETISGSISVTGVSATSDGSHFSGNFSEDITFTVTGFAPTRIVGSFSLDETCSNFSTRDCTSRFTGTSLGAQQGAET
ncbi:MAG TPA: hypothetical protein VEM33_08040, partial [Burkholderiales bacterium]|nr:hypothetical protein [Burkholderiales bacterium]